MPRDLICRGIATNQHVTSLGSAVTLLPHTHPVRCAERIAALDILTNGRIDFGVGRGTYELESKTFGGPYSQGETKEMNRAMFAESINIIKKCWTEESFSHNGTFFPIPDPITVVPKPVQKPHPPFWAACGSPDSFDIYPRMGMHIMPTTAVFSLEKLAEAIPRSYQAWQVSGHNEREALQVACLVPTYVDATHARATAGMQPYEMWYLKKLLDFFSPNVADRKEKYGWEVPNWDYITGERLVICGDPTECVDMVKEFEAAGVTKIMSQFQVGGMPHVQVMKAMELFAEEVIPHCR